MGTLSVKQMTDVLVDIQLTEATLKIGNDSIFVKSDTSSLRERFAEVFKKHDVDPDDFNASLNYYLQHIEELDQIYVEVINRLTELEATLVPKISADGNYNKSLNNGMIDLRNPWQRALGKTFKPAETKYFDGTKYSYPADDKPEYHGPGKLIER